MTKEELVAKAEKVKEEGKRIPCGKEVVDNARIATQMRQREIFARKQNG
ncbi:MAG: hypothetical protein IKC10_00570 [Alphaproteobacteria bacterium]|nr:hypothetical protein [Alphaproteobacteria bacterium]